MSNSAETATRKAMKQAERGCLDMTVGGRGHAIRIREEVRGHSVFLLWPTPSEVQAPYFREKLPPVRSGEEGDPIASRVEKVVQQALAASARRLEGEQGFAEDEEEQEPLAFLDLVSRFEREYAYPSARRKREIGRDLAFCKAVLAHLGREGVAAEDVDVPLLERLWELRKAGTFDARGAGPREEGERRPVSRRTASETIETLGQAFRWGAKVREGGEPLVTWNPVAARTWPTNPNPKRVICSDEKFQAILEVADQVTESHNGHSRRAPLREIWIVAAYTGHRRGAILGLKWSDWRPDLGSHGVLRWRAESDKAENEHLTPVLPPVREALEQWRKESMAEGDGSEWIFPAFEADGPVRGDTVHGWVLEAERLAGYEHEKYFGLHALRRRWAMKRKHLSPVDVAELGGWKGPETLQGVYQRADPEMMERVLREGEEVALGEV